MVHRPRHPTSRGPLTLSRPTVSRRRTALVGGTAALALLVTACGSKGAQQPGSGGGASDTLTLGAALSLTGKLAREGVLTKEGYSVCQDLVNAKGGIPIGDKKLKLDIQYQDDTSTPDTAAQLVGQFNDKGVKLILGSYGSANTEAQAGVTERNGQVLLASAGADNKIFEQGYKRTFGVLSPATEYEAALLKAIAEMAKPKPKTVAFLSADDGFSKTATEGGLAEAKKQGFTTVGPEFFPNGATDVSAALTKVKASKPDVILGSVHLAEGIAIVKQAKELGISPSGGFGESVAPPTPDFAKTLGPLADGVLGSSQWTPEVKGSDKYVGTAADYTKLITDRFGHAPDYHNAEATAACLAGVLAVEKAGSSDIEKVRDALAGLDEKTFFGEIKFNEQGQNVVKPMLVIQVQKGKAVTVWPRESASAPLVWPGTAS